MSKKVLGRGLNSLLPPRRDETADPLVAVPTAPALPTELATDQIVPNPFQPRRHFDEAALAELAKSIKSAGVIQPVVVRRANDHYELIAGERRWRAAQLAGLTTVPVRVQEMGDDRMLEVALIENIQRENLNPIETARAFQRLSTDLSLSHEEIGQRTGKDRVTISNAIRLLQLPEEILQLIVERKLSAGHARALLKITDPAVLLRTAMDTVQNDWSVRYVEQLTGERNQPATPKAEAVAQDPNVRAAVEELERALGTRVRIVERGKGKGRVEIDYFSAEDLDRIYAAIVGK